MPPETELDALLLLIEVGRECAVWLAVIAVCSGLQVGGMCWRFLTIGKSSRRVW